MYPVVVLVALVALAVGATNVGALPSPSPGHLVVSNSLSPGGSGHCTGTAVATYGFKATDIASGWRFDTDSACNIVNLTWVVKTPVDAVPQFGPHYVTMHNYWAIEERSTVVGVNNTREWWLDDQATTTNFLVSNPCQALTGQNSPTPTEKITLLAGFATPADPTPLSLYTNYLTDTTNPGVGQCITVAKSDYKCNDAPPQGLRFICWGDSLGRVYGYDTGHPYTEHTISYDGTQYTCTTTTKETLNLQNWNWYGSQACQQTPSLPGPTDAWTVDPTKIFTTVSAGQTTDFAVS